MSIASLWLIGCGNMAGAMLGRWVAAGTIKPGDVHVINRREQALPAGVQQGREPPAHGLPDAVLLGIKPQQLDDIAALAPRIAKVPVLLSILAGADEGALAARFDADAIVRVMPNMPVAIGKGVVLLQSGSADAATREAVTALMAPLGLAEWVEAVRFDAVTSLSGCGPAFVYRFIDAVAAAGEAVGVPAEQARRLALATVEGAAIAAAGSREAPAALADQVASPGGSTRAGLNVLDADDALNALLVATLAASVRRDAELAAEAQEQAERRPS